MSDYGIEYYAAYYGCSAETEASFETLKTLSDKIDEEGLKSIVVIEGNSHDLAETIKSNTKTKDQQILELNSMQSISAKDIESGISYADIMRSNLEVLKQALTY